MAHKRKQAHRAPPSSQRRRWQLSFWPIIVMMFLLWAWQEIFQGLQVENIAYSEFKHYLERREVVEATVEPEVVVGRIDPTPTSGDGETEQDDTFLFRTVRVDDPKLVEQLELAGVQFTGVRPSFLGQFLWAWVVPIGIMLLLWSLLARRMGQAAGTALGIGKSKAKLIAETQVGVRFTDVAGCDEAKQELQEVVDFLRNPKRYEALGAAIPKGVLLVGPPGTGKTLLARAVAGEAGVPFFSLSGSDFVEMFAGVGAARVRDLFDQAVEQTSCIVFIDELDAIGRQRGVHLGVVNDEREQTLNQLLVELDGFEANNGVIVLAATNRPDVLDRALLRPGRFDRQVVLDAPDLEGRLAILHVHTRNKPFGDDVDLRSIAQATPGFSGADLANTLNEAALLAARRGSTTIMQRDLEQAVEKVVAGPERKSKRLMEDDKRRVAFHEVGHALVAHYSPHADKVHKVSVVPRGHAALGYTLQLPEHDQVLLTRSELEDRLKGLLGGRAAEQLAFGEVSTGAENDLQRATAIARQMVAQYGMSEALGLAHVAQVETNPFLPGHTPLATRDCSEATAREIDLEVKSVLERAYAAADKLLREHRLELHRVAEALLVRETLEASELEALLEGPRAQRAVGSHSASMNG